MLLHYFRVGEVPVVVSKSGRLRFADTPMDYADATLLLLAERSKVLDIATLDRRGFSIYRTPGGKAMRLVL